ncbi:hypothetical protein ACFLRF_05565 [Candidatus Altiarchaeota archaeon]
MEIDKVQWASLKRRTREELGAERIDQVQVGKIRKTLVDRRIIFIAIPSFSYNQWIMQITQIMTNLFNRNTYLSLVWSPEIMLKQMGDYNRSHTPKINLDNIYFLDASTQTLDNPENEPTGLKKAMNALKDPVKAFQALGAKRICNIRHTLGDEDEILREVLANIHENKSKGIFIDSLGILSNYYGDNMRVLRLAHNLMHKLLEQNVKGVFPFPIDTENIQLGKELQMFADGVLILK